MINCTIFYIQTNNSNTDFKWVNNLSEKQIIIIKAIHGDSKIKKSVLMQMTDFSATALDNNLEILKKKKGSWSLKELRTVFGFCIT
ncbi:hypothetical protein GCM10008015_30230 [Flavobacterium palustre]|uniref:Uncharacterized protein n=1 Tax=Flavobacterium palustre TaxID=1476463 RepID=A0ABQ1HTZ3_9FLAO|nr:hypothetical protein GCM10008015_30230 [Flavobacterium palustre]